MFGRKIADRRRCQRVAGLEFLDDNVLLRVMAGIRVAFEIVDYREDHLVVGAIAAAEDVETPIKNTKKLLNIAMFLTQDFDDLYHRVLPQLVSKPRRHTICMPAWLADQL